MNTAVWRNLLWREWREQRWKLVALVAVVVGLHVWALGVREPESGHYATPFIMSQLVVLPIGSIFLAVGLAAGERASRTAPFLRSLPLDLRKAAVAKLLVAIAVIVLTQAVAVLMTVWLIAVVNAAGSTLATGLREPFPTIMALPWPVGPVLVTTLFVSSLGLWIAAPAVNSASEVRAGAIGLVIVVGLWTVLIWVVNQIRWQDWSEQRSWFEAASAVAAAAIPGGVYPAIGLTEGSETLRAWVLATFLLSHAPLAWWYITRLGQANDLTGLSPRDASPQKSEAAAWLGPPMRSPLYALCWKQLRQGVPVALAGAACAVAVAIVVFSNSYPSDRGLTEREQLLAGWGAAAVASFMVLGICAGLVGGAGALATELEPRLFSFWRSRPVSPDLWFWTTFLSGLALLLLVFGAPVLLADQVVERLTYEKFPEPLLPILAASYVAGAFTAAIVRHAVYASFIGIGVFSAVVVLPHVEWFSLPEPFHGPAILVASAMLAVLAWLAVRNDWSLRVG